MRIMRFAGWEFFEERAEEFGEDCAILEDGAGGGGEDSGDGEG